MNKSHEFSRRALNLGLAIYRVTANLPSGEVLVGQLRELGNKIAAELSSANATLSAAGDIENLKKSINCLRVYFQVAKAQNWIKPINWSVLDFEYYKLQQEVIFELRVGETSEAEEKVLNIGIMSRNIKASEKSAVPKSISPVLAKSNSRQSKILASLDKNGSIKMSDLIPLFKSDTSERTLRKELNDMVKTGLIRKSGVNKFTEYYKN